MKYWQLASGDQTRDYSEVFLNFGIASLGPGNPGPLSEKTIVIYKEKKEYDKIKWIQQVEEGDRIILRSGQRIIQAVGEVVLYNNSVYNYSNCFNDVDGWDLQHFVKVKWKQISKEYEHNKMTRTTMEGLHNKEVIQDVEMEWDRYGFIQDKYNITEPDEEGKVEYYHIEEALINSGFRIQDAENTTNTINRVEKLAKWYRYNLPKIAATEHEIRTFLVVPFLQALGWSPQIIGIETRYGNRKMDIVLFRKPDRVTPYILIETKRMYEGSAGAINQIKRYIKELHELKNLTLFIVTDGLRFWLYNKTEENWKAKAYMNFRNKRKKYSAYPYCEGVLGFIQLLKPYQE
jgi:hypothetical protein